MAKTKSDSPTPPGSWLFCIASLPTSDPEARMHALRTLEALGAAALREGVYLLPDSRARRHALKPLTDYIARGGAMVHLVEAVASSAAQEAAFRRLFDRTARYAELIKVIESLKIGFGVSEPGDIARVLNKQRREFDSISALDFFPDDMRERAAKTLAQAEAAVKRMLFPAHQDAVGPQPDEPLANRVWVTRKPLWADRLACAWLIRRFVDPEGRIAWLDRGQAAPQRAIGFAFDGAHFRNSATRVTYEEMLDRLGLGRNRALARIGRIVHFLEIQRSPVPEAAGVQTLLQGARRRASGENELLREAERTFDLLYDAFYEPVKR
jgi:hypothetical protein